MQTRFPSAALLVTTLLAGCTLVTTAATPAGGKVKLFNGKNLTGWNGDPKLWSVQDGALTGKTSADAPIKNNTFLVWTNGVVSDFELTFSYKIVGDNPQGAANSGCQYRSKVHDPEKFIVGGYQADFEAGKTYSGILYEERGRGILAQRGQSTVVKADPADPKKTVVQVVGSVGKSDEIQAAIRPNEWNQYKIVARGNHLVHTINGHVTAEVKDEQATHAATSGVLAFQLHAGPPMTVQFKDVVLHPLK